jgi:hypothetical protein
VPNGQELYPPTRLLRGSVDSINVGLRWIDDADADDGRIAAAVYPRAPESVWAEQTLRGLDELISLVFVHRVDVHGFKARSYGLYVARMSLPSEATFTLSR